MKKIWIFVSYLGLDDTKGSLNEQVVILSNRINFLVALFMLIIFVILRIQNLFDKGSVGMGSFGVILLFILASANLILAYNNKTLASRIIIIFGGPFIFVILPALLGYITEESFVYDAYILITFSILVPLLILPSENKRLFWVSFFYYFILVLSIDGFLSLLSTSTFILVTRIKTFLLWNEIAHIGIFLFLNLAVFYLRNINIRFENELKEKNEKLDHQNEELTVAMDALKTNQQQLIHSEKMASLGTLTAGVAHEINNPLNFIAGGLNIIEEIKTHEAFNDYPELKKDMEASSQTISAGLERATKIVRSLLAFAYSGKPVQVYTDVNEIIDNTLLFLNSKFDFEIEIQKQYDLKSKVPVFPELLHQILINIIDNAIFELKNNNLGRKKVIRIKSYETNTANMNYAFISILNTGPHIPPENISHLFDPFFTTKKPGQGSGLGLSIAFTLIKKHEGSLTAQNLDDGVEFSIGLPLTLKAQQV